jgi:hypothetical protein
MLAYFKIMINIVLSPFYLYIILNVTYYSIIMHVVIPILNAIIIYIQYSNLYLANYIFFR